MPATLRLGRLEQLRDSLFAEVPDDKEPEQASLYRGETWLWRLVALQYVVAVESPFDR
jgi:hypothetical protein